MYLNMYCALVMKHEIFMLYFCIYYEKIKYYVCIKNVLKRFRKSVFTFEAIEFRVANIHK